MNSKQMWPMGLRSKHEHSFQTRWPLGGVGSVVFFAVFLGFRAAHLRRLQAMRALASDKTKLAVRGDASLKLPGPDSRPAPNSHIMALSRDPLGGFGSERKMTAFSVMIPMPLRSRNGRNSQPMMVWATTTHTRLPATSRAASGPANSTTVSRFSTAALEKLRYPRRPHRRTRLSHRRLPNRWGRLASPPAPG